MVQYLTSNQKIVVCTALLLALLSLLLYLLPLGVYILPLGVYIMSGIEIGLIVGSSLTIVVTGGIALYNYLTRQDAPVPIVPEQAAFIPDQPPPIPRRGVPYVHSAIEALDRKLTADQAEIQVYMDELIAETFQRRKEQIRGLLLRHPRHSERINFILAAQNLEELNARMADWNKQMRESMDTMQSQPQGEEQIEEQKLIDFLEEDSKTSGSSLETFRK